MGSDDESGSSKDPLTRKKFVEEKSPGDADGENKSNTGGLTISQMEQAIKNAQHSYHVPYHTIQPFLPGTNFKAYEDRLTQYFIVNDVKEESKVPLFITIVGGEIYETLSSLTTPDLPSQRKFSELMTLLNDHFSPKLNKRSERAKFHRMFQNNGETVKEFSIRLQKAAQSCKFGDFLEKDTSKQALKFTRWALDEQLTDQFIVGVHSEKCRQVLINNDPKDYQSCYELAVNMEMADRESKHFSHSHVNNIKSRLGKHQSSSSHQQSSHKPSHKSRIQPSFKSQHSRSRSLPTTSEKEKQRTVHIAPENTVN